MRRGIAIGGVVGLGAVLLAAVPATTAVAAAATCQGRPATITGTDGADWLVGTPGPDVIAGLGGHDRIRGLGGNDLLCGGSGSDELRGGFGHDRLVGGANGMLEGYFELGDLLAGGPGNDHLAPGRTEYPGSFPSAEVLDFSGSMRGVTVDLVAGTAVGDGNDTIDVAGGVGVAGSDHDDHILGTAGDDFVLAGAGDDRIETGDGDDIVIPDSIGNFEVGVAVVSEASRSREAARRLARQGGSDAGRDTVSAGAGDDLVLSWEGRDRVDGGAGRDFLELFGSAGSLSAGPGHDFVLATVSLRARSLRHVALDGGNGVDQVLLAMMGGRGAPDVRVTVDAGVERIRAKAGTAASAAPLTGFERYLQAAPNRLWTFRGSTGADSYQVLEGRVRAFGLGGNDALSGGPHRDLLDGGAGVDRLRGGDGTDICRRGEELTNCER